MQLLAVTEGTANATGYTPELDAILLNEGKNLAERLNAHYMTSNAVIQHKSECFGGAFVIKEFWEKNDMYTLFQLPFLPPSSKRSLRRNLRSSKLLLI